MVNQKNKTKVPFKSKRFNKDNLSDYGWAYLMVAPTIIGLIILNIWPLINTIFLSFNKTTDFGANVWVGLENYKKMFADPDVLSATINTLKYTIISVPIGVMLSLMLAVFLNSKIKGKTIYRTIYFLPMVSAPAAIAMVWRWLYSSEFGLINYVLSLFNIQGPRWLSDPKFALLSIVIVSIWSYLGYNMVILLAGIQEIPNSFYEAADIDGAGPIKKFFSITVPLVSPTLFFVVITSIITGLQIFDLIFMMIDKTSAVLQSTQSLVYLFYKHSFVMNDKGYASAIVMLLLLIILLVTAAQMKLQKKWVHYE